MLEGGPGLSLRPTNCPARRTNERTKQATTPSRRSIHWSLRASLENRFNCMRPVLSGPGGGRDTET